MFQRMHNLKQHEKFVHQGHVTRQNSNKLITCEKCGMEVKERRYRFHKAECHTNEIHECKECGTAYKSKHSLNAHQKANHEHVICDHFLGDAAAAGPRWRPVAVVRAVELRERGGEH